MQTQQVFVHPKDSQRSPSEADTTAQRLLEEARRDGGRLEQICWIEGVPVRKVKTAVAKLVPFVWPGSHDLKCADGGWLSSLLADVGKEATCCRHPARRA